ncbi:MAG: hypothetical protein WCK58_07365 [Chloroflexota bacterium]
MRRFVALLTAVPLVAALVTAGVMPAIAGSVGAPAAVAPVAALPAYLPNVTQFDIDGFLQAATLGGPGAGALQGGSLTVNGQVVTVPAETIVILPANALTWQELFAQAPAPYTGVATGMAMADVPTPIATYEVHVIGNRVGDQYIAGMVNIDQQGLNSGAGYINFINYATGQFEVGGLIGVAGTGTVVELNDPLGRFGRLGGNNTGVSVDPRFTVDADNPTVAAGTGFPMCIPRVAPAGPADAVSDPLCPQTNRIPDPAGGYVISQTMTNPALIPLGGALDPSIQAPMEVGDYVTFAGNLVNTSATPTAAVPGATTYILAHTVGNNMAIYTAAGTNPAYVSIEVGLIGTGGLTVLGAGEAAIRTRFEGMTSDATRNIHLYGVDVHPDGSTTDRDWGTIGVDPGPAGGAGAVQGRWRFRPPCLANGTVPTKPQTQCVNGPGNDFLPPTREVRAVIEGQQGQVPGLAGAVTYANGIYAGQYHAPIDEYIFPENVPGTPIVANNFEAIPFLACGGYSSATGVIGGQLNPWPGATAPVCPKAPTADAGGPYTVNSGATVTLAGAGTGSLPLTFSWAVPAAGTLSDRTIAGPVFTAPRVSVSTVINLSFTVSNTVGSTTATTTVTVNAAQAPVVDPIAAQTVTSGSHGTFAVTGSDPNLPAHTPLTFHVTQTGSPALGNVAVAANGPTGANVDFNAPGGVTTPTDITVTVTATNSVGVVSAPVSTTVTITPAAVGTAPVAAAGGPYTVTSGSQVTLAGSATGSTPVTFLWTVSAGTLNSTSNASPVFTAPSVLVDTVVNVSLTATNAFGSNTSTSTINVSASVPPTVAAIAPVTVSSGANGSITVTGSDPNTPAKLPLVFTATQAGAPALLNLTVTVLSPTSARLNFTAPTLPLGQVTSTTVTLTVKAANSLGQLSANRTVVVTVKPLPDAPVITNAEFRTSKVRLVITASSNVISPNVSLVLLPYVTTTGSTFDPSVLGDTFTNGGGGLYTLTLVGAPQPAAGLVLQVRSNLGGLSPLHALDRIRA